MRRRVVITHSPSEAEKAEWVAAHATVRCAHYTGLRMKPDRCPLRIQRIRSNPVLVGQDIAWECESCTGPLPVDPDVQVENPTLPKLSEHGSQMLRARSYRCCKCGTTDVSQFDKGHSRKCSKCCEEYNTARATARNEADRQKRRDKPKILCILCGENINPTGGISSTRLEAQMCVPCFERTTSNPHKKTRIDCRVCGKHLNLGRHYSQERIALQLCGRCYQGHKQEKICPTT